MDAIARFGVPQIDRTSVKACARDLRMSNSTAARLFAMHLKVLRRRTATTGKTV